jgi:hypothetical protein
MALRISGLERSLLSAAERVGAHRAASRQRVIEYRPSRGHGGAGDDVPSILGSTCGGRRCQLASEQVQVIP